MSAPDPLASTGFLVRDGDNVTADLVDEFGFVRRIRGVPAVVDGVRGYALTSELVYVPVAYRIPGVDD